MTYLTPKEYLDELPERRLGYPRSAALGVLDNDAIERAMRSLLADDAARMLSNDAMETFEQEIGHLDRVRRDYARRELAKEAARLLSKAVVAVASEGAPPADAKCSFARCGRSTYSRELRRNVREPYKASMTVSGRPYCKRHGEGALGTAGTEMERELLGELRSDVLFSGRNVEPEQVQAVVEKIADVLATETYGDAELSTALFTAIDDYAAKWGELKETVPA